MYSPRKPRTAHSTRLGWQLSLGVWGDDACPRRRPMQSEHVLGPEHAEQLVAYLRFMRRKREQCVAEVAAEFKELPRKPRACLSIESRERAARTCTRARGDGEQNGLLAGTLCSIVRYRLYDEQPRSGALRRQSQSGHTRVRIARGARGRRVGSCRRHTMRSSRTGSGLRCSARALLAARMQTSRRRPPRSSVASSARAPLRRWPWWRARAAQTP